MGQSLGTQMTLFAGTMVLGSVIGVLYDISCCLCRRKRGLARGLLDISFCLFTAALILLFLLIHTQGQLRSYLILGGLLGFGAEHVCFSPLLCRVLRWLFPNMKRAVGWGRDGLLWLFSFPRGK